LCCATRPTCPYARTEQKLRDEHELAENGGEETAPKKKSDAVSPQSGGAAALDSQGAAGGGGPPPGGVNVMEVMRIRTDSVVRPAEGAAGYKDVDVMEAMRHPALVAPAATRRPEPPAAAATALTGVPETDAVAVIVAAAAAAAAPSATGPGGPGFGSRQQLVGPKGMRALPPVKRQPVRVAAEEQEDVIADDSDTMFH
jgi:hypothetical protein